MNLLLDSCAFIWLTREPGKLSPKATLAINDPAAVLYASHASLWEIAIKHRNGRLILSKAPRAWWPEQVDRWMVKELPLIPEIMFCGTELPRHHNDPFDRAIIAQALLEDFSIISPDAHFPPYGVKIIW